MPKTEPDCIFCKIVAGEISAHKVYEDGFTYAFLDANPVNPGHTLLVPKKHVRNILDMDEETITKLGVATLKVARAVKKGTKADGLVISSNNEPAAGQVVFHAHTHIIPRHNNDGLHHWPQGKYEEGAAEQIRDKITSII